MLITLVGVGVQAQDAFITTWNTDPDSTGDDTISIPLVSGETYDFIVDWGDGCAELIQGAAITQLTHTYNNNCGANTTITGTGTITPATASSAATSGAGTYTVEILGTSTSTTAAPIFPRINFAQFDPANIPSDITEVSKILEINQWGTGTWSSFQGAFQYCFNLIVNTAGAPDLTTVTSFGSAFKGAVNITNSLNGAFENWMVDNVTNMSNMFNMDGTTQLPRNGATDGVWQPNLSSWNVQNVTDFTAMLAGNSYFDGNVSNWVLNSTVTPLNMFQDAIRFTGTGVDTWDITTNSTVFDDARAMFFNCAVFDVPSLPDWTLTNRINNMFFGATIFNGDISTWDVTGVTEMLSTFQNASNFNSDISNWQTNSLTNLRSTFQGATVFNQDLSTWDVDMVTNFREIFSGATSFNQDISNWKVDAGIDYRNAFVSSGLSVDNTDNILMGWAEHIPNNPVINTTNLINTLAYCSDAAEAAKISIEDNTDDEIRGTRVFNCNTNAFGMMMWFKANDNGSTTTDGNFVNTWVDQSGNAVDHTAITTSEPQFIENTLNFNPTLRFTNSALQNTLQNFNQRENFTAYFVAQSDGSDGNRLFTALPTTGNNRYTLELLEDSRMFMRSVDNNGQVVVSLGTTADNGTGIMEFALESIVPDKTFAADQYSFNTSFNNTAVGSFNPTSSLNYVRSLSTSIGARVSSVSTNSTPSLFATNDISEIIFVRGNNNAIVESYLALKYGQTLDQNTPTDYVASDGSTVIWNATTAGVYNNAIIGIGRDDAIELAQGISTTQNQDDIVTISLDNIDDGNDFTKANSAVTGTFDETLEYITLAHNGEDIIPINSTQIPANYNATISRIWQAQRTSITDTETINFKFEGFDDTWALVVDTDTDFSNATPILLDGNGEVATTIPNGVSYITLVGDVAAPGGELTDLILWLRADQGVTNSGGVTLWEDQSAFSFDFTPMYSNGSTAASPQLATNYLNFNPAVNFGTSTADILGNGDATLAGFTANNQNLQIYAVLTTFNSTDIVYSYINNNNDLRNLINERLQNNYGNDNGSNFTTNIATPFYDTDVIFKSDRIVNATTATITNSINGGEATSSNAFDIGTFVRNNNLLGGRGNSNTSGTYSGHISEFILYNASTSMTSNQIESYLSIKYGIPLNQSIPQNYTASDGSIIWNATTADLTGSGGDNYNNDIFVIGRDDISGLDQRISTVQGIEELTVSTDDNFTNPNTAHPALTNNLGFVVHAANTTDAVTDTGTSKTIDSFSFTDSVNKIWNVQETGDLDNCINYQLNTSNITIDAGQLLYVVIDSEPTFSTNPKLLRLISENGTTNFGVNWDADSNNYMTFVLGVAGTTNGVSNLPQPNDVAINTTNINQNNFQPSNATAYLETYANQQGLVVTRLDINNITNPVEGMLVYDTGATSGTEGFKVYTGTNWRALGDITPPTTNFCN